MANVHRIGDYQDNEAGRQGQQQVRQPMMGGGMFGGGGGDNQMNEEDARNNPLIRAFATSNGGDPRQETFWTMLKTYFCPTFTWKTCIFIIALLNLIMFVLSLALTSGDFDDNYFLGINTKTL